MKCDMNLHSYSQKDLLDRQLRSGMKNWLSRQQPPVGVRQLTMEAASGKLLRQKPKKPFWRIFYLNRENTTWSFDRFAKAKAYSLQIGVLIV